MFIDIISLNYMAFIENPWIYFLAFFIFIILVFIFIKLGSFHLCSFWGYFSNKKVFNVLSKSNILIWKYDLKKNTLVIPYGFTTDVFKERLIKNMPNALLESAVIHEEYIDKYIEIERDIRNGTKNVDVEIKLINKNHDSHWYRITYNCVEHKNGLVIGLAENIDEKKMLEQLIEDEKVSFYDAETVSFYKINVTDNIIIEYKANDASKKILEKYTKLTDIVKAFSPEIPDFDEKKAYIDFFTPNYIIDDYDKGKHSKHLEYQKISSEGMPIWAETTMNLFKEVKTKNLIALVFTKVMKEERKEQLISETMQTGMQAAVDNSYEFIIAVNLSTASYHYFQTSSEIRISKSGSLEDLSEYLRPIYFNDGNEMNSFIDNPFNVVYALQGKKQHKVQARIKCRRNNDYQWYEHIIIPINDSYTKNTIYVFCVQNIQELKNSEENLRKALETAKAAANAKQDFLSHMSHEIRTPLNGIKGMLELLRSHYDLSDNTYLNNAMISVEHLTGLINDILDMSKIESGRIELKKTMVSRKKLITYIDAVIKPMAEEKKITFNQYINGVQNNILVDEGRIKQILINLLSNAVKYTNVGGEVSYTINANIVNQRIIKVDFVVEDNGIGMTKEFLEKAFVPFEQENRSPNNFGTGLGLPITKKLVELMGGTLHIESEEGIGTKAFVSIETEYELGFDKDTQQDTHQILVDELKSIDLKSKRILVVDDNELNREIAVINFKDMGCMVYEARDGQEAVDMFAESEEGFYDIIFMDIMMPVLDGIEATRMIRLMDRNDSKTIPIVAMTANAFIEDVHKSLESGMNYHLSKPFDIVKIKEIIVKEFNLIKEVPHFKA